MRTGLSVKKNRVQSCASIPNAAFPVGAHNKTLIVSGLLPNKLFARVVSDWYKAEINRLFPTPAPPQRIRKSVSSASCYGEHDKNILAVFRSRSAQLRAVHFLVSVEAIL